MTEEVKEFQAMVKEDSSESGPKALVKMFEVLTQIRDRLPRPPVRTDDPNDPLNQR